MAEPKKPKGRPKGSQGPNEYQIFAAKMRDINAHRRFKLADLNRIISVEWEMRKVKHIYKY